MNGICYVELDDGTKYFGNNKNDSFNGYGMLLIPDETIYLGKFKNDEFTGLGLVYDIKSRKASIKQEWQEPDSE